MEPPQEKQGKSLFGRITRLTAVGAAAAFTYARWGRPALLNWGATEEESAELLPGDEFVPEPRYQATHAITINAPVDEVWPWLVQIGADRGGFYSYEWLENLFGLDIHNAEQIIDAFQDLKVGDHILLANGGEAPVFEVALLEAPVALVLRGAAGSNPTDEIQAVSWAFILREDGMGSRLIIRFRMDYQPVPNYMAFHFLLLEPAHFVMERKMLQGLKHRAERAWMQRQITSFAGDGSTNITATPPAE